MVGFKQISYGSHRETGKAPGRGRMDDLLKGLAKFIFCSALVMVMSIYLKINFVLYVVLVVFLIGLAVFAFIFQSVLGNLLNKPLRSKQGDRRSDNVTPNSSK
jgi:hypothetical protein